MNKFCSFVRLFDPSSILLFTSRFLPTLLAFCAFFVVLRAQPEDPIPYAFTTLAGVAPDDSARILDGTGRAARFNRPNSVAVENLGNIYVVSIFDHAVRKIDAAGVVTTFAGNSALKGWADGVGTEAFFNVPRGVATDAVGNVYLADMGNHTIRKITPSGVVTTLAGQAGNYGSIDATGAAARFNSPTSVAVDLVGNVYVGDSGNHTIRKITPAGAVTTIAGTPGNYGYANGTGSDAQFSDILGMAVDSLGNLYLVGSLDYRIRRISPDGVVSTFAGEIGSPGMTDGTGTDARFNGPEGIAIDIANNLFVGDAHNCTIRKITPGAVVTTIAGSPGSYNSNDGSGSVARFNLPKGVAVDSAGNVFVADSDNNMIRKVSLGAMVTTVAGAAGGPASSDGAGREAQFNLPYGIAVDASNTAYVADYRNRTIRKITAAGVVTTIAGTPGVIGDADGVGGTAQFRGPIDVAVDGSGNVYVADFGCHAIRKITPAGAVTTFAGLSAISGFIDGANSTARFYGPYDVAVDNTGTVYVADSLNLAIRKITTQGVVSTFAVIPYRNSPPLALVVDSTGCVFFSSRFYVDIIVKVSPAGVLSTIAGNDQKTGWSDGVGRNALFNVVGGLAVDSFDKLYVADLQNHTIRTGQASTAAPSGVNLGDFDGDGKADFVWTNTETGDRSMWLMNGNTIKAGASLGVVPVAWVISATADYDGDGKSDLFWTNTLTGDRAMWRMNGSAMVTNTFMGTVPVDWVISGTGDFNGDGKSDIVWTNTLSGDRAMWLLNGSTVIGGGYLGTVPSEWLIVGVNDFNGDGKADLVWSNIATGERSMWFQNGSTTVSGATLNTTPVAWVISGTGDFNNDGKADIILTNTASGDRVIWLMNGSTVVTNAFMGSVSVDWKINATGDFNSDGKKDLIWTNTISGDRAMWLLNGATVTGGGYLGTVPVKWKIN